MNAVFTEYRRIYSATNTEQRGLAHAPRALHEDARLLRIFRPDWGPSQSAFSGELDQIDEQPPTVDALDDVGATDLARGASKGELVLDRVPFEPTIDPRQLLP